MKRTTPSRLKSGLTGLAVTFCLFMAAMSLFASASPAANTYVPTNGCYIGAVLDWAEVATSGPETNVVEKFAKAMRHFNEITGKKHAFFEQFFFFPHGAAWEDKKFLGKFCTWDTDPCDWATPKDFVMACDQVGAAPILTIEPHVFRPFFKDWFKGNLAYDQSVALAKRIGEWGKPVFIRFAHEMNGSWYPWAIWSDKNKNLKKDPGEETGVTALDYRTAFRNFAEVFRAHAPNTVLIWCPNQGWLGLPGTDNYTPFYPGNDVVDWVGLDFYERGWFQPKPHAKLWGGLFHLGLHNDDAGDPKTSGNKSVNFYETYYVRKNKPILICETSAQQTYRADLPAVDRDDFSNRWKAQYWNAAEHGWLYQVYGTTAYTKNQLQYPIDKLLPGIKGIVWFSQAKEEPTPGVRKRQGAATDSPLQPDEIVWFDNAWCDFRVGYNSVSLADKSSAKFPDEISLYRELIGNDYFLSTLVGVSATEMAENTVKPK